MLLYIQIFSTYDYKPDRRMTTSKNRGVGIFKIYRLFVQKKGTRLWSAFDIHLRSVVRISILELVYWN